MQHSRNGLVWSDLPGIVATISRMGSTEDAITFTRDSFGLDHATYLMASNRSATVPFIRSTYPAQWVSRYVLRGYVDIDPVIRKGFASTEPFAWHELTMSARELEFMTEAREYGAGERGYSIPVVDRSFPRSLLTLTSSATLDDWIEFVGSVASSLIQIAHLIHRKAIKELPATFLQAVPALAPREAECLLWTARGKEAKAIAVILELSEYTVRSYLRTARRKLDCRTLSQAVARAVQTGIINP